MRRLRYFWVSGIAPEPLCALSATPWQWLCVTADIMWFLLSPGSEADDGDFWALLCSPATAMTERRKKMLEHDDQWHFSHGLEIPQSVPCCPCLADREIRSLCSAWNFPGLGLSQFWGQSHQLTDTLSWGFSIFFFCCFLPKTNTV